MTGLDRAQTPKTRPMPHKRTALVASLDIACMITRLKPHPPSAAFRGRSHAAELIGDQRRASRVKMSIRRSKSRRFCAASWRSN
jgi:cell division protein FtsA